MSTRTLTKGGCIAVVKTKIGEYFGLVDPTGFLTEEWDIIPGDRVVIVEKYVPILHGNKAVDTYMIQFNLERDKYRKDAIVKFNKYINLATKKLLETFFNTNNEESEMANSTNIVDIAKTGDVAKTESALQSAIGQAIKRALWVAEKRDEFLAIPVLQELDAKYNPAGVKNQPEIVIANPVTVTLEKADSIDVRVWNAIIKKGAKLGMVLNSNNKKAEMQLPKKEAVHFIKAVEAVKGIKVSSDLPEADKKPADKPVPTEKPKQIVNNKIVK
jgi:hypothetical protein